MNIYQLDLSLPVTYIHTGKFEAPSPNWIHENFPLLDFELIVITKGTLFISYNNTRYSVSEGEYLLLHPLEHPFNRRKGFKPSSCSFYWMHFSCSQYELITRSSYQNAYLQLPDHRLLLPGHKILTHPDKVLVLMKQLQDFVRSNYNVLSLNYMATTILCEISNQILIKEINTVKSTYKKKQLYNDMVDYIKGNIHLNLRVSEVSAHFGYNDKYLSHLFKSVSGVTLKQYILQNKIETANFLLTDTNNQINDISFALGFNDSHNFMKVYKKITGLTPSEYRNAYSQRLLYHK